VYFALKIVFRNYFSFIPYFSYGSYSQKNLCSITRGSAPLFSSCFARRKRYLPRKPSGRLPTLQLPMRVGVQFQLVRFYYAQRRAGCPRSSPRRFAANLCCITWATDRRAVAHLTIANTSWHSVQTCSVLLRTEAGIPPAFLSVAASRQLCGTFAKR
jgi:hypothetical protein